MKRTHRALIALGASTLLVVAILPTAAATGPELTLAAADYRPAAWDPAIPEHERKVDKNWSFGNPDLGGLLTLVIRNDGGAPATVEGVTVDGVPLADFLAATCQDAGLACTASPPREMAWARWLPGASMTPTIGAGDVAVFQLKRTTLPGASTTIGVDVVGGDPVELVADLDPSPIRLGLAYRDGDDAVIVVRNDGDTTAGIGDVLLDGAAKAADALGNQASIAPGRTAILRLADAAPAEGTYAALTVETSLGSASAGLRLFTPFFPIGTWLNGSGWNDPAFITALKARHIDTSWGYWNTTTRARSAGLKLIADAVPCAPGQSSGCIAAADEDVVAAYAYGDEKEFSTSAQENLRNVELRRTGSTRPTYVNNAAQRVFQVYAAQADIGAMDHYTSGIGLCTITGAAVGMMQGQPVEWAGNYTRQLKLNVEPNPAWVWSQAGNSTIPARSCWHGVPTVAEMQAQLFSELANGAKGITWFIFSDAARAAETPGLWDEAGRLGGTLAAVRDWLRTGDLDPGALVTSSSRLEVGVVAAPGAVVIPILDLEYLSKPSGYAWAARRNVSVSVRLPAWMTGGAVTVGQVRAGATTSLDSTTSRSGDVLTITIPELHVGTVLVIRVGS